MLLVCFFFKKNDSIGSIYIPDKSQKKELYDEVEGKARPILPEHAKVIIST